MSAKWGSMLVFCALMGLIICGAFLMSVFVTGFLRSVWEDKQAPRLFRIVNPRKRSRPTTFLLRALLWGGAILCFLLFIKVGSTLAGSLWRALN